jgi:hypothetical protein
MEINVTKQSLNKRKNIYKKGYQCITINVKDKKEKIKKIEIILIST